MIMKILPTLVDYIMKITFLNDIKVIFTVLQYSKCIDIKKILIYRNDPTQDTERKGCSQEIESL